MSGRGARSVGLLYFSGAGGTALVAELLGELLSRRLDCEVASIEDSGSRRLAERADLLVFLYPTYYLKPAPSMAEYVAALGPFDPPKAAYVVSTCELYTENSVRALALALRARGLAVAGSEVVHAPGSDVTLAIPAALVPWWYRFEKGLPGKLLGIAREVESLAAAAEIREAIPRPKWYTPFTQALQVLLLNHFDLFRRGVRVIPERCAGCGACVGMCGRRAWSMGSALPVHDAGRCELCGRCMHRCPSGAIVLLKSLKDNRRLGARLYSELGEEARSALGLASREARRG